MSSGQLHPWRGAPSGSEGAGDRLEAAPEEERLMGEAADCEDPSASSAEAPQPRLRSARALAACSLACLAAAGAAGFAAASSSRSRAAEAAPRKSLLSAQAVDEDSDAWATEEIQTGCDNWREIKLKLSVEETADDCADQCAGIKGCVGFDYQFKDCSIEDSAEKGTCILWNRGAECKKVRNPCWNNYVVNNPEEAEWTLSGKKKGCSNKDAIQMSTSQVSTVDGCGNSCANREGCTGFQFAPLDTCKDSGVEQGTCILLNGECKEEDDDCWDFYEMEGSESEDESQDEADKEEEQAKADEASLQDIPDPDPKPMKSGVLREVAYTGDNELQLDDASEFKTGDVVVVYDNTNEDTAKVINVGQHQNLMLNKDLEHRFAAGAPVGGYPAGTQIEGVDEGVYEEEDEEDAVDEEDEEEEEEEEVDEDVEDAEDEEDEEDEVDEEDEDVEADDDGMLSILQWTRHPDKCLNEDGGKDANGAEVNIFDCVTDEPNQRWYVPTTGKGTISWSKNTGKCLHVQGSDNDVTIYMCVEGESAQQWLIPSAGDGQIKWAKDNAMCLEVKDCDTTNGANVVINTCAEKDGDSTWDCQQWHIAAAELEADSGDDGADEAEADDEAEQAEDAEGAEDEEDDAEDDDEEPADASEVKFTDSNNDKVDLKLEDGKAVVYVNGEAVMDSVSSFEVDKAAKTYTADNGGGEFKDDITDEELDDLSNRVKALMDQVDEDSAAPAPAEAEDEEEEGAPAPAEEDEEEEDAPAPAEEEEEEDADDAAQPIG